MIEGTNVVIKKKTKEKLLHLRVELQNRDLKLYIWDDIVNILIDSYRKARK